MPKRKRHSDKFEELSHKLRKLQRELKRAQRNNNGGTDAGPQDDAIQYLDYLETGQIGNESENSLDTVFLEDTAESENKESENKESEEGENKESNSSTKETTEKIQEEIPTEIDCNILEILGADPAAVVQFSEDIHKDLASRLEHLATMGLSKETRKELLEKYLIPANCTKIGSPGMNPEIKAAVTETVLKRDKGIEMRQKQLAGAIAGLATIVNKELQSKEKNNERVKQLMDVCRILCDIQHAESVIRRNFAIFSIKKDLKDHMVNTKIDKFLFGEDLAEALKSAKAVNKSGTELKVKAPVKHLKHTNNLNSKAPAPARRQQGPPRSREPANQLAAGPPQRYNRAPMHAHASKPLQHPAKPTRRR